MQERHVSRYSVLAADYDGTLAHHGRVDASTIQALERLREAGMTLIMVTGRRVPSLLDTFDHVGLFDVVVAENGAIVYDPRSRAVRTLADAPPAEFVRELQASGVPAVLGYSIIETVEPHQHAILELIRRTGIEWHITFNKGSVMGLPAGVTKCTGLAFALKELGLDAAATIGVGDAENDHAFLSYCGLSVAVANALPSIQAEADLVTRGRAGEGVVEIVGAWLSGRLDGTGPLGADVLST